MNFYDAENLIFDRKISSGAFGDVFKVRHRQTKETFALKLEKKPNTNSLRREHGIYKMLTGLTVIPNMFTYSTLNNKIDTDLIEDMTTKKSFLLLSFYKKSLRDISKSLLNNRCAVYTVGYKVVGAIEQIHKKGIVHRDLKPGNLMVKNDKIILIDFGLAKKFYGESKSKRRTVSTFIGTPKYAPISAHDFNNQQPVDDLESILYLLVSLLYGRLPWKELKKDKEKIAIMKKEISIKELTKGDKILMEFYNRIGNLDYDSMKDVFYYGIKSMGMEFEDLSNI